MGFASIALVWAGVLGCASGPAGSEGRDAARSNEPERAAPVSQAAEPRIVQVVPAFQTDPVAFDADDPAIWVHPSDPSQSLILGTDKQEREGSLYSFDLEGRTVERIAGLDRPNNVDVAYGFSLAGVPTDLAVVTERGARRLRIFAIDPARRSLRDVTGRTAMFAEASGSEGLPMGIALYRRPGDGALFAIVSRKAGPKDGYLGQYRLVERDGKVDAEFVRTFGRFSGEGEIEAVAVDPEWGYVYYADEGFGVRKYLADPDAPEADQELAVFATEGWQGDREGIAIFPTSPGRGVILVADQVPDRSRLVLFARGGTRENPHDHSRTIAVVETTADSTDGIEATARPLGPRFPNGILVVMNSRGRNFLVYDMREVLPGLGSGRSEQVAAERASTE